MKTKTEELMSVAENAAAISDQVHNNRDKYDQLYQMMGGAFGGFPGIWNFIAECALELDRQHPGEWNGDWIETCWAIGDLILRMEDLAPASEVVAKAISSNTIVWSDNLHGA